jgi:hypothetical protein
MGSEDGNRSDLLFGGSEQNFLTHQLGDFSTAAGDPSAELAGGGGGRLQSSTPVKDTTPTNEELAAAAAGEDESGGNSLLLMESEVDSEDQQLASTSHC